jgi:hypothetical protein
MPKYQNTSSDLIVVGSLRWEPKDTLETLIWLESLPAGIVKLADAPYLNPVVLSQKVIITSTITVPNVSESGYEVRVYVTAGEVSIKINSDSGTAQLLGVGMSWGAHCLSRTINDLRFTISSGTAYVTIKKV